MAKTTRYNSALARLVLTTICLIVSAGLLAKSTNASEERNTYKVKNAFRDAVRAPIKSTVRVLSGGRRVALGAIVGADGYVLTKASEVKQNIECQLFDGRRLKAEIVGTQDEYDLALLKIDAKDLPTIQWGDSDPPPVGSWLATPGLETIPISIGVVSVAPRKIERRITVLGVKLQDAEKGPQVFEVVPGSNAAKAGIIENDIITHLDGKREESLDGLIKAIRQRRPGDKVRLKVLRGEREVTVDAELGELAQLTHGKEYFQFGLGGRLSQRRAGFPIALQHDTVLQPNQCGGPLVDLDGKTIGINIARANRVTSYALPASVVIPLVDELKKSGTMVSTTPAD
ncbi:MAG: PDZ domain-containing protein [Planctomycetes bacterium]|nr:PDZ domain-containing protein [Planctomycetota bacterium]MBL7042864.1 PDZ domain-containing protein [Pirellulaceae bacterium]